MTRWTTEDFDDLSWHDTHVHGMSIREGEHGTGELSLDLDFILQWLCSPGRTSRFLIAPATLTFHKMSDLRVALDYASVTAGICPFSLAGIERSVHTYPSGATTFRWHIKVNWPQGELSFLASGFTQELRGASIETSAQYLSSGERGNQGSGT